MDPKIGKIIGFDLDPFLFTGKLWKMREWKLNKNRQTKNRNLEEFRVSPYV
jgi:hypothetical protein